MAPADAHTSRPYQSAHRADQARRTRQRVLSAATAEFLQRGYAGTTMRAVAGRAEVSVPTVEALFGTKARLLKTAVDVAIAGDDEPVAVLNRSWAAEAEQAGTVDELLAIAARVITPAQARSAGLVLAVLEASPGDPELAATAQQLVEQRARTAQWLVDRLVAFGRLASDLSLDDAVDTLWVLIDPAVFDRLTRLRHWPLARYQDWFARSARRLLCDPGPGPSPSTATDEPTMTAARRRAT